MPLTAGTRIGPYEIVSALGAGGMGEVFLARDTKLNRDVAIKVLPDKLATHQERLARFEREAQMLAALNHARIAQIYGVVELGDRGTHATLALVMEYVDGEDLAQRLARSRMPIDDAIAIAAQIAEAVEAAHERGIVHRDLKPANVKVTPAGVVKVLDFGLAKAVSSEPESRPIADSPTVTSPAEVTQAGTLMGTAQYLAPEQIRGRPTDRRVDIWAFGCVLYEMLAGHPVFSGESVAETLGAIVKDSPRWEDLPAATPAAIRRLLTRCLIKDPVRRLRDIGEARIALEDQLSGAADEPTIATAGPRVQPRRFWQALAIASSGLALALAVVSLRLWHVDSPPRPPIVRFDVLPPAKALMKLDLRPALALSRDGSMLAFTAILDGVSRIYVRSRDSAEARALPGTEGGSVPAFSPDGRWIAFFADGKVKKVSLDGPAVTLASASDVRGITWLDDRTLIFPRGAADPLVAMSADGGATRALSTLTPTERSHRWPEALPGGKAVMFTVGSPGSPDNYEDASIEAVIVATGERRVVWRGAAMARYSSSGHLILSRGSALYAVRFDPETLRTNGNPTQVATGVERDATTGAAHFAVAADGTLAIVPGGPQSGLFRLVWVDRNGEKPQPLNLSAGLYHEFRVAPDGSRIALLTGPSGGGDIWIYDVARRTNTRLTFTANNAAPVWSVDGKDIYYTSFDSTGGSAQVYRKRADGSGETTLVGAPGARAYVAWVSKGGTDAVLDFVNTGPGMADVIKLPLRPNSRAVPLVDGPADTYGAAVSPDGRWLAYHSDETGRPEVYVRGMTEAGRWQVSTTGGEEPHWSKDGRELYYRIANRMMTVAIERGSALRAGTPRVLFDGVYNLRSDSLRSYDVDPATGRFLMIRPPDDAQALPSIRVTLNWFDELRRLASAH